MQHPPPPQNTSSSIRSRVPATICHNHDIQSTQLVVCIHTDVRYFRPLCLAQLLYTRHPARCCDFSTSSPPALTLRCHPKQRTNSKSTWLHVTSSGYTVQHSITSCTVIRDPFTTYSIGPYWPACHEDPLRYIYATTGTQYGRQGGTPGQDSPTNFNKPHDFNVPGHGCSRLSMCVLSQAATTTTTTTTQCQPQIVPDIARVSGRRH